MQSAAEKRWLAVWMLKFEGECVATELQLIRDGIVSALRADSRDTLRDISPGACLNWKISERLYSDHCGNLEEYRMDPGASPYKARWSEEEHNLGYAVIYYSTMRARLAWF